MVGLEAKLAEIRRCATRYKAGTRDSFTATLDLYQALLSATVMDDGEAVKLQAVEDGSSDRAITGRGLRAVKLRDGKYLRILVSMRLVDDGPVGIRLKVMDSSYQYQVGASLDPADDEIVFRYDYTRQPPGHDVHPLAHLNIYGIPLVADSLPQKKTLARIHFPTGRVSIEAVIRCLIEQYKVPTRANASEWRQMLACSEEEFLKIAHQPRSGPDT
jgi:hypothetical protein